MYKQHVKRTVLFTILGAVLGLIMTFVLPKVFESNLEIMLGQNTQGVRNSTTQFTADVDEILRKGTAESSDTERQVLSSNAVFFGAFQKLMQEIGQPAKGAQWMDYYKMYNVQTSRNNGNNTDNAAVANAQVRAWDPIVAQKLAAGIAEEYNAVRKSNAQKATQNAIVYLEGQLPPASAAVEKARKALEDFKNENKIANYEASLREKSGNVSTLQLNKDSIDGQVREAQGSVRELEARVAALPARQNNGVNMGPNPKITTINTQLAELEVRRQQLLSQYYPDAEPIKQLDTTMSKLKKEVEQLRKNEPTIEMQSNQGENPQRVSLETTLAQRRAEMQGLLERQQQAVQSLEAAKAELAALPSLEAKLAALDTDSNIARNRYETVKTQLTALKDRQELIYQAAVVLAPPQKNPDPVSPDKGKFLFLGTIAGLSIGLILSYFIESLRLRIHTSGQLTELTGLPVAAAVPALRGTEANSLKSQASPSTSPSESYRFMSFAMLPGDAQHKSFMFTGVKNAVGSFSSALQFAKAAAQGGAKVLLVDGDLIKQGLTKSFDAAGKRGFNNLLSEDPAALHNAELVIGTAIPNLFLLPAGSAEVKSVGEVNASRLESVVEALKKYADVVIFAVPPCDILADAAAVSRFVDETCLVVSARTTNYRQIPAAHEIIQRGGGKKVSLILTDANVDEEAFTRKGSYLAKA